MPLLATRSNASAQSYGLFASGETLGGMVLMTPSSVTVTGTGSSSSITENGSVTFTSCETLNLNGIFTSAYRNYIICMNHSQPVASLVVGRLMANGVPDSTASAYVYQSLTIDGSSIGKLRSTSTFTGLSQVGTLYKAGFFMNIYGPALAQKTSFRTLNATNLSRIQEYEGTHNQVTSYDGYQIYPNAATNMSGMIAVYGLVGQ